MFGLVVCIIVCTLGVYGIYKVWLLFHKIVGIEPGVMHYGTLTDASNDSDINPPRLKSLDIPSALLNSLDIELKHQILRLDSKVCLYRQWQKQRSQEPCWQGDKLTDSEATFVLDKLLNTHLKEALQNQHSLTKWQQQRRLIDTQTNSQQNSSPNSTEHNESQVSEQQINQTLLQEIIDDIEARLDGLLLSCEQQHVHELQVMYRYLQQR